MSQEGQTDLNALWTQVTDEVKARIVMPSLWRAMEAGKPLAIEEGELVLGFGAGMGQGGLLMDQRHRNVIEQILEEKTHQRLRLHLIDGDTLEDWELIKQQRIEAERLTQQSRQQYRQEAAAGDTWDAVGEHLIRRFSETPHRSLASVQGRYLDEAVNTLAESYGRLMFGEPGEMEERAFSRVLTRVAERVAVPEALIAQMVYSKTKKG
jgi:hypothetical protein